MTEIHGTVPHVMPSKAITYPDKPVPLKARVLGEWLQVGEAKVTPVDDHLEIDATIDEKYRVNTGASGPFSVGFSAPKDSAGSPLGAMRPEKVLYLPHIYRNGTGR